MTIWTGIACYLAFNAFWFIYMGIIRYQKWKQPPPPQPKRTCEVIRLYS